MYVITGAAVIRGAANKTTNADAATSARVFTITLLERFNLTPMLRNRDVGTKRAEFQARRRAVVRFLDVEVVRLEKSTHAEARTRLVIDEQHTISQHRRKIEAFQ